MTPSQIRAYVLADNRLALDAGWDKSILKIELQQLVFENDIDISLTGFEVGEIDLILNGEDPVCDGADDLPDEQPITVTQPGDLWQLGEHRVLCGDARAEAAFATLMGGLQASVIFTDPPYNVVIDGHASGNGEIHHREFAMASGEMDEAEFTAFLTAILANLALWSTNSSLHYICMDWRHMRELLAAGQKAYDSLLNLCVWAKNTGGMGSFYRSQHELVFVFRNGKGPNRNNMQLVNTAVTELMSGIIRAQTPFLARARTATSWPCTRQSNRSHSSLTPCSTVLHVARSSWIPFWARAVRSLPRPASEGSAAGWNSIRSRRLSTR